MIEDEEQEAEEECLPSLLTQILHFLIALLLYILM